MMKQVYVAHERVPGGLCKIGYSKHPHKRIRQVEDLSGVDLTLTFESKLHPMARRVELTAHKILRDQGKSKGRYFLAIDSEWFNATPDEARGAVLSAMQIVDNQLKLPPSHKMMPYEDGEMS